MWDSYNGQYACLPEHINHFLCVEEAGDGSSILLSHTIANYLKRIKGTLAGPNRRPVGQVK